MSGEDFLAVAVPPPGSTDLSDFVATRPTTQPPREQPPADPVLDAFGDARQHAAGTPLRGRGRSMKLVDNTVCRYPCQIPGHNHQQPVFRPQPDLDEVGVGWTVQHVPHDRNRSKVPQRCVVCWTETDDLREHVCTVMEVVNG